MESMVPVCDKRYHIYNRFRHFWAEIKKLWNYPLKHGVFGFMDTMKKYRMSGMYQKQSFCQVANIFFLKSFSVRSYAFRRNIFTEQ